MRSLAVIGFIFLASCASIKNSTTNMSFDWQGHRGCSGLMPENTIPAMLTAIDLGVTTLEMDVVIAKDRQVIISHEPFFNHLITTKPDGSYVSALEEKNLNIYQMNYDEVMKYDVGLKPYPKFPKQKKMAAVKPRLADLIDKSEAHCKEINRTPVYYNIEIKSGLATDNIYHPEPAAFVELLMSMLKEKHIEQRVIIQSFDMRPLQYLHTHYPKVTLALLVEDSVPLDEQLHKLGFTPNVYSPEYHLVTSALIKQCKEKGVKVIPWTVNSVAAVKKLKAKGVDGIITDYP